MQGILNRLYRTKVILSCLILVAVGILFMVIASRLEDGTGWTWLQPLPWQELGGILVGAGLLGVWLDHYLRREQDQIDELRLRRLLHEQAPALRDAVLEAFAADRDDLVRVATPDTLDRIITNSLALRLHDDQFAAEVYADIRDQAISASERWRDASLSIELNPLEPQTKKRPRPPGKAPELFSVTVRWEYVTTPAHSTRRFVCLSDREEYTDLVAERGATSAWFMKPSGDIDPSSPQAFELVRFSVDGEERPIRRSQRKTSQVYSASVGTEALRAGKPVTIAYTYRTATSADGHLLFFDIEQPTRDLKVDFNYDGCGIETVSTLDLIPSVRPTRIERPPVALPDNATLRVDLNGWIFPRSGIAFVWTLTAERTTAARTAPREG